MLISHLRGNDGAGDFLRDYLFDKLEKNIFPYFRVCELSARKLEKYNTKSYSLCMRKLCTKWFKKWAKKANLSNLNLLESINNLERGLSVADLGGDIFKIRVKRTGKGKSAGFRTIVVYRKKEKIIFLYGFSKNEKSNIDKVELQYFKKLGSDLLALKSRQVTDSIEKQILFDLEVVE